MKVLCGSMAVVVAVMFGLGTGQAQATLIGDTVEFSVTPTPLWTFSPTSAMVGAGVETTLSLSDGTVNFLIDVDASSFTVTNIGPNGLSAGANEEFTISDLDWVGTPGTVVGATLTNVSAGITGLVQSDISFTADSVSVFFDGGAIFGANSSYTVEILTRHDDPPTNNAVPEPITATLGLMGLGVLGATATKRRRVV